MIKRVLILSAGAAAGWLGHTAYSKGRDAVGGRARQRMRDTVQPDTLGEHLGQMAATAVAASARGFARQLRDEVPRWRTAGEAPSTRARDSEGSEPAPQPSAAPQASTDAGPDAPGSQHHDDERRAHLQARLREVAAATDWRAVAEAANARDWRGAATSFITTGLAGSSRPAGDETIPGTVADPTPTDPSNPGDRKQS